MDAPLRTRRRLVFSVRAILLVVLVVGAWMGRGIDGARRQRRAVEAIERAGGWVSYEWSYRAFQRRELDPGPPGPEWLSRWLGPDYLGDVASVGEVSIDDDLMPAIGELRELRYLDVGVSGAPGPYMARLGRLKKLESLYLDEAKLTDDDLAHLSSMSELRELDFDADLVTDAGIRHLAKLSHLKGLALSGSDVTTLEPLRGLPSIGFVYLEGSRITDDGLAAVAGYRGLGGLYLGGTAITDRGLAHLKSLPNLALLDLSSTRITDAGLVHLHGLCRMEVLNLSRTAVTDAGLAALAGTPMMESCVQLVLIDTQVTPAAAESFRTRYPGRRIYRTSDDISISGPFGY